MDLDFNLDKEKVARFFREVADVMARHPEVASKFVLAERGEPGSEGRGMGAELEEGLIGDPPSDAATRFLQARTEIKRKVCVQFGFDLQTGERICLRWVDEG
jgi:hypothetical protein